MKKLSEVCRLVGVTRRTMQEYAKIRKCERTALLPPTAKTEKGYWLYSDEAIVELTFIQVLREAGLERKEIRKELERVKTGTAKMGESIQKAKLALEKERKRIDGMIKYLDNVEKTNNRGIDARIASHIIHHGCGNASFLELLEAMSEDVGEDIPENTEGIAQDIVYYILSLVNNSNQDPKSDAIQKTVGSLADALINMMTNFIEEEEEIELTKEEFRELCLEMADESNVILKKKGADYLEKAVNCYFENKEGGIVIKKHG